MRLKYKALCLALSGALMASASASAQQPAPGQPPSTPGTPDTAAAPPQGTGGPNAPSAGTDVTAPANATPQAGETAAPRKSAQEEIVVTGSRIRRKDLTTPAPVTVISREQIQSSSATNLGDFLQLLPEQGGAINTNVNNGGTGETQISLRNLGAQRTLVLVDGKRMVYGMGQVGAGSAVDLNTIPTSAVERIEVLKDGASSVYGSDAIGGVVNIITRKRVEGVQLSAYTGISGHNDAGVSQIDVSAGSHNDRGGFMLGAGYFTQKSMFASSRDWATNALSYDFSSTAVGTSGSGTTPDARVNGLDPSTCPTQLCKDMAAAFGSGKKNFMYDPGNAWATSVNPANSSLKNVGGFRLRNAAIDAYNYQAVNYLVTPSDRVQLFGNGEYRISDFARAYMQASYVNRQSRIQIAAEPLVTTGQSNLALDANNPYNPFGIKLTSIQRRLVELNGRAQDYDTTTFRTVAGIDGTLSDVGPMSGWFWDVSFNYGRSAGNQTVSGFLNTQFSAPGFGPGFKDPATGLNTCGTAKAPIDNCTPINLFGRGSINSAMATQLGNYTGPNPGWTQQAATQVNLSGELFTIAADRPAALALGYEHRNEYGGQVPNPIVAAGWDSDTGSPGPTTTKGSFYTNEGYAELVLPLINHVAGAENLEATGSFRIADYSTFGTNTTYKLGLMWAPIRDVALRGTYSTGFRAPGIADLYSTAAAGNFESANDPCADTSGTAGLAAKCNAISPGSADNGQGGGQINSITGGNTKLQPETAKILTAGLVFQPSMVRNFSATVDFYNVDLTNTIGSWTTQLILNKCYGIGTVQDTSFCNLVVRDPTTNGILTVTDVNANVGGLTAQGIDLAAQYGLPTDVGRFTLQFNGTYLLKYDQTLPDGTLIHGAGNYDSGFNPRVKFNAGLNYSMGDFSSLLFARFLGPFIECAPEGGVVSGTATGPGYCYQQAKDDAGNVFPSHKVPSSLTWDLMLAYRLRSPVGQTRFTVGVRNMFNRDPAKVYDSFLTYADTAYDFVGRYFYGRIEHTF